MSAAQYRVSIGWTGRLSGYFVVGVSTIAPATNTPGYDVLGDNIAIPGYKGTYDILADDRYGPLNFTCTRGRDDNFSNMLAGQLELMLNDVYPGRYNPRNPASPLAGQIVPFRPVRLDTSLDGGTTWGGLFNGWLEEASSNVDWDSGSAKMTFKDIFLWLDRARDITIAPTGQTTVGAVISLILTAIGWPIGLRSIATGSIIPDFSLSPGTSALEAIGNLLVVDQGYFFHGRDNIVTYWDRYQIARKASIGTFDAAGEVLPGVSLGNIKNTATATKTGGVPQYAQDDISVAKFTPGAWDDVTSDYFMSDVGAKSFCQARVALGKDPLSPVWTYSVEEDPELWGINQLLPSLYWPLSDPDANGGNPYTPDLSGNGNTGIYDLNGVAPNLMFAQFMDGKGAAWFNNAIDAHVTALTYQPFVPGSKRTFMGWVYRTTTSDLDIIMEGDGAWGPYVFLGTAGTDVNFRPGASPGAQIAWDPVFPGAGQWVHWAITWDDSTRVAELFINRVSQGKQTAPVGAVFSGTGGNFGVGGRDGVNDWSGYMRNVAVFERILTPSEIAFAYSGYLNLLLSSEFLDRVSINEVGATTDYNIQKIVHRGEGGTLHQTDWVLAEVPDNMPFIVGRSKIAPAVDTAGYDRVWY